MANPSFLDNFLAWCGESECPQAYLEWAAYSLIAACLGNRTFVRMRIGAKDACIYPNLYTILVGPSANYKSFAIKSALELLGTPEAPVWDWTDKMNLYTGRLTSQGMYDEMRMRARRNNPDGTHTIIEMAHKGQLYIVTDELAADIGLGERATNMIMALTKMFFNDSFSDRTRTAGKIHLEDYSINWLAATTPDWMQLCMNREVILGGFLGRVVVVAAPTSKIRIFESERVHGWDNLRETLIARLEEIMSLGREVPLAAIKTSEATRIEKAWYLSRPNLGDEDDLTSSNWRRQQALILKLAWILAVNYHEEPYITEVRMIEAIALAEHASKMLHSVLPSVTTTNKDADAVLRWLEKRKRCTRTELNRKGFNHNMRADDLNKWVDTWEAAGLIEIDRQPPSKGGTSYTYKGKRSRV